MTRQNPYAERFIGSLRRECLDLPRQIVHSQLREGFTVARYVEDPFVLGIHPAMAILAKTKTDKVCVC